MYALCATLSDAERKTDRGAFFRSIHGTLNHNLSCDLMFLSSFRSGTPFGEVDGDPHSDFDTLHKHRAEVDAELLRWSHSVSPAWLNYSSTYTHFEDGVQRVPVLPSLEGNPCAKLD